LCLQLLTCIWDGVSCEVKVHECVDERSLREITWNKARAYGLVAGRLLYG